MYGYLSVEVRWTGTTKQGVYGPMDLQELEAEIGFLLTQMNAQPEDRHELYLKLREKLNEMRAYNMPVPDDLLEMEKHLEQEFSSELAGKKR